MEKLKRKRINGIDFARSICTIGIIVYHFIGKSNSKLRLLRKTANSTYGFMFVTSFFSISGAVLHYNYPKFS